MREAPSKSSAVITDLESIAAAIRRSAFWVVQEVAKCLAMVLHSREVSYYSMFLVLVSRVVITDLSAFSRLFRIHELIPGYLYPGVNLVLLLLSIAWPEPW